MANKLVNLLKSGGVAVLPTDTIYGLHTRAEDQTAVAKIYKLKVRNDQKPLIVLISSVDHLKKFGVVLNPKLTSYLNKIWPNPVSVILPVNDPKWEFLDRGSHSLAFRMPKNDFLLNLMAEVGPLVSTSVNLEGQPSAETIDQARSYFGDQVDFYEDMGILKSEPSTVIKITNGQVDIIRQGLIHNLPQI